MRSLFPGHYRPSIPFPDALKGALVIFDTNALLNFYSLSEASRKKLFGLMETLEDQRWIPHQVALEFHRNRINLVDKANATYQKIPTEVAGAVTKVRQLCDAQDILRIAHATPGLLQAFEDSGKALIEHLSACAADLPKHGNQDAISETFADLFEHRVGPAPESQEALNKLWDDGDARYEAEIPPGFGDVKKAEVYRHGTLQYKSKFGDLILWRQILAHVVSLNAQGPRQLIFVTDDAKKDWWLTAGSNSLGPRPELAMELKEADPNWSLWMFTSSKFFQEVAKVNAHTLDKNTIADVEHAARAGQLATMEQFIDVAPHEEELALDLTQDFASRTLKDHLIAFRKNGTKLASSAFVDWLRTHYDVIKVTSAPFSSAVLQAIVRPEGQPDDVLPTVMLFLHAHLPGRGFEKQLEELGKFASKVGNPVIATIHLRNRASRTTSGMVKMSATEMQIEALNIVHTHPDVQKLAGVNFSTHRPEFNVWPVLP
ncbi:hypothetical protein LMG3431_01637 [Achromobacter pestifer]|uniref:PIN like domain-containing protein n=2 Tax=Achromobacter pestifer TaxID=1353889 RepID=A0A6S6ZB27_9BURK|nr:hypothetical protein LMG3431_01637 [Achromobacter pestifer]